MNRLISERTAGYFIVFAGFGLLLTIISILWGLADSGYASPSWLALILGVAAFWPTILCGYFLIALGIFNSLKAFGETSPILYTLVLPAVGWGLVGVLIASLSRKRRTQYQAQTPVQSE